MRPKNTQEFACLDTCHIMCLHRLRGRKDAKFNCSNSMVAVTAARGPACQTKHIAQWIDIVTFVDSFFFAQVASVGLWHGPRKLWSMPLRVNILTRRRQSACTGLANHMRAAPMKRYFTFQAPTILASPLYTCEKESALDR